MTRFVTFVAALWLALPAVALAAIDIEEVTSPGGINAWLVRDASIPFTALELHFRGGTSLDAPDARGSVNLMTSLLEEGSGDRDAQAHAKAVEALAARFDYAADDDAVSVSAQFLSENRDEALALLRETIHAPLFDAASIERVRGQILSGLRSDAQSPNAIAGETFGALVYGDHPYASEGEGTIDSVTALTRDDVVAAHRAVFARDRVYVSAVGDITAEELGAAIDLLLADLPETGAPLPGPATPSFTPGVTVVPFDTPQSVALFGQPGLERDDPDFFAAFVMNQIFGGSGESRLNQEVRVKRGLTYSIFTALVPKDLAAIYIGQVATVNARMAETVEVIQAEWARLATDGVTQEELDAAKTYLTGAYPLRFDGNARIARTLVALQMADLPIDYVNTRNAQIEAVTLDDVNRVAASLIDADGPMFVVVGQPEGLLPVTE
jgi:zinc protease